jgi:hypothetical protein
VRIMALNVPANDFHEQTIERQIIYSCVPKNICFRVLIIRSLASSLNVYSTMSQKLAQLNEETHHWTNESKRGIKGSHKRMKLWTSTFQRWERSVCHFLKVWGSGPNTKTNELDWTAVALFGLRWVCQEALVYEERSRSCLCLLNERLLLFSTYQVVFH